MKYLIGLLIVLTGCSSDSIGDNVKAIAEACPAGGTSKVTVTVGSYWRSATYQCEFVVAEKQNKPD